MKMFFKMVLCALISILMLSVVSFAAPEYVGIYEDSGKSGMILITNPDRAYSSTYSRSCSVAGVASAGSKIYVYSYEPSMGNYKLSYENGYPAGVTVGASGMFVIPLKLSSGSNGYLLRAEKDGEYQNTVININVLSTSMFSVKSALKGLKFK